MEIAIRIYIHRIAVKYVRH